MFYGNGHFACPSTFYCYRVSHGVINNRRTMGVDRYESEVFVGAWIGGVMIT